MTTITTKRLTIKKTSGTNNHLKIMCGWLNDPENVRYSEQRHRIHDEESQAQYIADGADIFREILSDDLFVGTITAHTDRNNSVADVGILIGKEHWGRGYGYEAWSGFCDHLLNNGIRKIEAGCMTRNNGMIHVFNKYGMTREGYRHAHFLLGMELVDMVQYAKFHD